MKYLGKNISIALCAMLFTSTALSASDEEVNELDSVTVIGSESDYTTKEVPSILRGNIKLEDTPKSIQVYNRNFINDFQIQDIVEVLTMSSNVVFFGDNNGRASTYAIRGFMNVPLLRDGININTAIANPDVYNFERIEVLKGPSSLQYGQGGAGGLINLVKKKPDIKETTGEIGFEATSENRYTTKFDIAGSINEDGSARYRLVSTYTKDDPDSNFNNDTTKIFVAPSIAYDINDNHTLTAVAEYFDVNRPTDYGTPIKSDGTPAASSEYVSSNPDDEMTTTQKIVGFDLDSTFDSWDSKLRYRYVNYVLDIGYTYTPRSYIESTGTIYRLYSYMYQENTENLLQYTIDKEIDTAGMKHNVSLGVDYSKVEQNYTNAYSSAVSADYLNQDFSNDTLTTSYTSMTAFGGIGNDIDKIGAFVQDSIKVNDNFTTYLGLRTEHYDVTGDNGTPDGVEDEQNVNSTTKNLGFVYKFTPSTSLYSSYSESFHMQDIRYIDEDDNLLDPEEGKGYELGIKQKLFNDRFNLTTALFKIDKDNVAVYNETTSAYNSGDTQKSKGFELDLSGEISTGWSIVASYGYTDTKTNYVLTTRGVNTYYNDKKLVGVPKHNANLFSTYYINENLYFGGGARYLGGRYVNYANTVKVAPVTLYNVMVGYTQKDWKFKLAVKNLTDEVYYESVGANGLGSTFRNNDLGDPRTVIASITYAF